MCGFRTTGGLLCPESAHCRGRRSEVVFVEVTSDVTTEAMAFACAAAVRNGGSVSPSRADSVGPTHGPRPSSSDRLSQSMSAA